MTCQRIEHNLLFFPQLDVKFFDNCFIRFCLYMHKIYLILCHNLKGFCGQVSKRFFSRYFILSIIQTTLNNMFLQSLIIYGRNIILNMFSLHLKRTTTPGFPVSPRSPPGPGGPLKKSLSYDNDSRKQQRNN